MSYDFREVYLFNLTYYDRRVLLFVAPEMSLAILRPRVKKKRLDKHTKINKQQLKRITIRGKGFQRSRRRSRPCWPRWSTYSPGFWSWCGVETWRRWWWRHRWHWGRPHPSLPLNSDCSVCAHTHTGINLLSGLNFRKCKITMADNVVKQRTKNYSFQN